jgi:hypothetical protein
MIPGHRGFPETIGEIQITVSYFPWLFTGIEKGCILPNAALLGKGALSGKPWSVAVLQSNKE